MDAFHAPLQRKSLKNFLFAEALSTQIPITLILDKTVHENFLSNH